MRLALSFAVVVLCSASASAQFGNLTYNFFGPAGTTQINSVSAISFPFIGAVGVANEPTTNMINTRNWTNGAVPNTGQYYAFGFTSSEAINIPSISVNALSTAQGPSTLDIRSSLDGFTSSVATQSITPGSTSPVTFSLPSGTFGNIAANTSVQFRIYGYNALANDATSQLGFLSTSSSDHGIIVPIAPVPEPVSIMACSALGLGAFGFARRRLVKK